MTACAMLLLGASLTAPAAWAQSTVQGVPNAVQGFSVNRDQPIQIESSTLEVREKESVAIFTGNVHVIQGDTHMQSATLKVFYENEGKQGGKPGAKDGAKSAGAARPAQAATPGPGGQQQIQRLEAGGTVVVTQKDQKATGDAGIFDTRSNSVTLRGNVVVSQGPNVLKGDRLIVNLESGVSRMESSSGRVQGLFQAGSPQNPQQPGGARPGLTPGLPQPTLPRTKLN
jgi:lipopolysaccharide export system protein LptA